jgi:hypothetical protein
LFGKEFSEFSDRLYGEVNGTYGRYFDSFGYLSFGWALASYFNQGKEEDGLVKLNAVYFSDLAKVRKTQIRQYAVASYIRGLNRILDRTLSLEGKWEDENDRLPMGNERLSIEFQTVYFLPWNVVGFQFAVYHTLEANFIATSKVLVSKESFFPALHIGTRVLNDNLVFPSFEIEVGYYGKNSGYSAGWEIKLSTTLPDLFNTKQRFEPKIAKFN